MYRWLAVVSLTLSAGAIAAQSHPEGAALGAPQVALTVDPQRVLHTIDPNVYGHFLEHIYHSCNGGLWGDTIWNRSFEELAAGGSWRIAGHELVQSSLADNVRLVFGDPAWTDYEFTLQAQKTDGQEGFLVLFRANGDDFYWANLGGWNNQRHGLERGRSGQGRWRGVGQHPRGSIQAGRWYNVRVRCEGPHIQVWLGDQRVLDFTDNVQGHRRGAVGVGTWITKARYRNLKVTSLDGKTLFAGLPQVPAASGQARHWAPYGPGRSEACESGALNGDFCQHVAGTQGETGVAQHALCLRAGDTCRGSLWARGNPSATLVVRVLDGKTSLVEKRLPTLSPEWKEYPLEFRLAKTVEDATLQIGLRGLGEAWIDQVSLTPDSCRAAGGFRPDLLDAVAGLRPPVIRWPGGCYAERYRWKDGIGPQHKRGKFPVSMWDDVDTNNLGTDEFIDLCRRVKAEPLVVVNIGRHDRHSPREAYVKEACEWIEYCNGPADSTWGKLRAAHGHPQPYNVRYWEIDNETWSLGAEAYAEYVQLFAPALRKADPRIKIAVCGSAGYGKEKNGLQWNRVLIERCAELFDYLSIHHYENPNRFADGPQKYEEFFHATGELIARSKNPQARIFVSEWNAQSTDWRTGLYCGGILNAFERTPSVGMAAPALFLRHVSATNWDNALINFDQSRWFPAPNYVVMQLWRDHFAPQLLALDGPQQPLNAAAARSADGRRLVLKTLNPSPQAVDLTLTVKPGFALRQARLLLVAPGSLDARNTLAEPHKVHPQPGKAECVGQTVRCTLPALSAAVLVVEP
jgi:alpha-N-arabinofuranosidase